MQRERLLDPVDRISEVLFGLIMAVTIVGSLSIATAGRGDVRMVLAAALGCNVAWGLVDAVMFLVRTLTERSRIRSLARRVAAAADTSSAHRLIVQALPDHVVAITGPDDLEAMRRRIASMPDAGRVSLRRVDYLAASGIFLLVVLATFPVVLPFLLTDDAAVAMRRSQVVTVAMLFIAGFLLGRHGGYARPLLTGVLMAVFGVVLIVAVKALGG